MAILATSVKDAIEAAIAAIVPTHLPRVRFIHAGEDNAELADQAVTFGRRFDVGFAGGQIGDIHLVSEHETVEALEVVVQYPSTGNVNADDDMIRSDVSDIRRALNDPTGWPAGVVHQIVVAWARPTLDARSGVWRQSITVRSRFFESSL